MSSLQMLSAIADNFNFAKGQKYYVDQQLLKLQWYHKLLKNHTIASKRQQIRHLLRDYENAIGYNTYCNVRVGDKFKLFKYTGTTIEMTNSSPYEVEYEKIQENQMFKGVWAPVNYDLYPEEVDETVLRFSSLIVATNWYNSWAQLEYIKLQMEAIMLEENIHMDQENEQPE